MKKTKDKKAVKSGELPQLKERVNNYLRLQTARLPVRARLIILVAFCLTLFSYCLYLVLKAFQ